MQNMFKETEFVGTKDLQRFPALGYVELRSCIDGRSLTTRVHIVEAYKTQLSELPMGQKQKYLV